MYLVKEYHSHSYGYYDRIFVHIKNTNNDVAVYFSSKRKKHSVVSRKYFIKHLNLGKFFIQQQSYCKTLPKIYKHLEGKLS